MNNITCKSINDNLLLFLKLEALLKQTIVALSKVEKRCDKLERDIKKIKIINEIDDDENKEINKINVNI